MSKAHKLAKKHEMLKRLLLTYLMATCFAASNRNSNESADQELQKQPPYHGIDLGPFGRHFEAKSPDSGSMNDLCSIQDHPSSLEGDNRADGTMAPMNTESSKRKRDEVAIRAYWRANGRMVRMYNVLADGNCTNLGSAANVLHWNVSGPSCRFMIFKDQHCSGPVVHSAKGFTVFNDGVKETPCFGSVRFECRDLT